MSEDRDPAEGASPSEFYDAGDAAQVTKRRKELAVTEARKKDFIGRVLLGDRMGRAVVWDLLGLAAVFSQRFGVTGPNANPQATEFFAGEREHALQMLRYLLRAQPQLAAQMISENDHG